jgi:DNA-binding transcriptional regulator YdaS (Cro superfamily)
MSKLLSYLNGLPKDERARYISACGTSESYLRKAMSIGQQLGSELCVKLEVHSQRAVTRKDLRPSDWQSIWPELVDAHPAARRAADALPPEPDRPRRHLPDGKNVMSITDQPVTFGKHRP